jgi:hypothetical protein
LTSYGCATCIQDVLSVKPEKCVGAVNTVSLVWVAQMSAATSCVLLSASVMYSAGGLCAPPNLTVGCPVNVRTCLCFVVCFDLDEAWGATGQSVGPRGRHSQARRLIHRFGRAGAVVRSWKSSTGRVHLHLWPISPLPDGSLSGNWARSKCWARVTDASTVRERCVG